MAYNAEYLRSMEGQALMDNLYKACDILKEMDRLDDVVEGMAAKRRNVHKKILEAAQYRPNKWVIYGAGLGVCYLLGANILEGNLLPSKIIGSNLLFTLFGIVWQLAILGVGAWVFYLILLGIDWILFKDSKLAKFESRYAEESAAAETNLKIARQKADAFRKNDQMNFVRALLPREFQDISSLYGLLDVMENNCIYNLQDGIVQYHQFQKLDDIHNEAIRQRMAADQAAAQQEYQSRLMYDQARENAWRHQDMMNAQREATEAQRRTARATEKLRDIEEQREWERNHPNW